MSNPTSFDPLFTPDMIYFQPNIIGMIHINSMVFAVAYCESEGKNVLFTFFNPFLTSKMMCHQPNIIGVMHMNFIVFEVADYESEVKNVEFDLL